MAQGERSTNRLVAWLVGVASAALVVAVLLLMAFPGTVAPPVVPQQQVSRDAASAASSTIAVDAAATDGTPGGATPAAQRTEIALAERSLWVRIRAGFAGTNPYYTGPLGIDGEPGGPRQLVLSSSTPVAVRFHGASPLVFTAKGYVPVVCVPPPDADGDRPLDIELQPESSLRFRWLLPPELSLDTVQLRVHIPATNAFVDQSLSLPWPAETTVALAGGNPVPWTATARAGSRLLRVSGTVLDLGLAEEREVVVDLGSQTGRRHRLIGPSAALLPHLTVSWPEADQPGSESLPVDRDGGFTRPSSDRGSVTVNAIERPIATVAGEHGEDVLLTLAEPVVGVRLVLESGVGRPSEVLGPGGRVVGFGAAEVHVFARSELPPQLRLRVNGQVATFSTSTLAASADWLELRLADALPAVRLTVHVGGPAPVAAVQPQLQLVVARDGGSETVLKAAAERVVFDLSAAGDWLLHWRCAESLGPVVGRVRVAAGVPAEQRVEWPLVHEWTGEILGFSDLPLPQRWHRVGFGAGESILNGWVLRPDPKGRFRGFRLAADPPNAPAFLAWGIRRFEALIEERDDERRHVVVRPNTALRWVEVQIQAAAVDCTAQVFVVPTGAPPRMLHELSRQQAWPIPVIGDETIVVALCASQSSLTPVLAWLSVPAGATSVAIAPMALRRLELRDASGGSRARTFSPVGPHGVSVGQIELPAGGRIVVEVPCDTRGLIEWIEHAVEVPIEAGEVVVLP